MAHPYKNLPETAFWRTAVADKNPLQMRGLWAPKFRINKADKIVTAGSCFAQHIGRALEDRGYHWFNAEPAPSGLPPAQRPAFNYGVFSFRTGNIYTARMLRQWLELAYAVSPPFDEVWEQDGRFFDPLRPMIEPGGFATPEEVRASRTAVLAAIRKAVTEANIFIFTLGLTESWQNTSKNVEYAMCPGTGVGQFDPENHVFVNHKMPDILADLTVAITLMQTQNPELKVLLTVSPVPLTATASGQHALTATSYSKSVLRAVAGQLSAEMGMVDYFPSYEMITNPAYRGMFFAPNMRTVVEEGVQFVMQNFFDDQAAKFGEEKTITRKQKPKLRKSQQLDVICEEEMLSAFAPKK